MAKALRFIALARVSSREQEREGFSLEVQTEGLERYAERMGGQIIKLFRIAETASKKDERKTFKELIAYAKKNPGKISYGTSGVGNTLHMSVELMSSMTDAKMTHIPYKGPTAYTDVAGGVLDMAVGTFAVGRALYKEGRIRPLAVTSPKRWMEWNEIPAIAETVPGYEVVTWAALCVPGKASNELRDRLNKMVRASLARPDVVSTIEASGSMAAPNSPEEMRSRVQNDISKWKKVAEYAKIDLS